ncbi:hypothetical protein NEIRO03_1541 [Nematocida sp. AWRm78]|nr:hypothetical protein NEIRO02_1569 [Nematocida sp. AWRm79]KAI5184075.1 hypothetical protein NEIRO03_1541 [Nematocida sp. AWRm78]
MRFIRPEINLESYKELTENKSPDKMYFKRRDSREGYNTCSFAWRRHIELKLCQKP